MNIRIFLLAVTSVVCIAAVGQKSITEREYWLDGKIDSKTTISSSPAMISLEGLLPGFHSLTMRIKDNTGLWSPLSTKYFVIPRIEESASNITEREYWLDGKYENRVSLSASPAIISLESLQPGFHSLSMRIKNDLGIWSAINTKYFVIPRVEEVVTITRYMYWFDDDMENLVSGKLTEDNGIVAVSIGELEEGDHTISWRVADSKDAWSNTRTESFKYTKGTPTQIGELKEDSEGMIKILRNGNVYILTDDSRIYTLTGQEVR